MKNLTPVHIHERVFNQKTVHRATRIYRHFIDVRLDELTQAYSTNNTERVSALETELNRLRENLMGLEDIQEVLSENVQIATIPETSSSSFNELFEELTHEAEIELTKRRSKTPSTAQALSMYEGYIDVHLDLLSSAMKQGDMEKSVAVKSELDSLQQCIMELKGANN